MNRKSTSSAWVLHKIETMYETDEDDKDLSDEEYYGNYTFIIIEDDKKKTKTVSNIKSNLQIDCNFEDE